MLGTIRGEVRFKEPLSFHTSLRIGGPADIFITPLDVADIRQALLFAAREQLPVTVIGGGNNILIHDRGVRGVVLKLQGCLGRVEFFGDEAVVGAGVTVAALVREAAAARLGGLEALAGTPTTVGGALALNTRVGARRMSDFVTAAYYLDEDANLGELKPIGAQFNSAAFKFPQGTVILGCRLRLVRRTTADIQKDIKRQLKVRRATQPVALAATGSVWKDPAGAEAAGLIAEVGLKGKRLDDAEISSKHANFIVNRGRATASSVEALMELTRVRVEAKRGVMLQPELRTIGG